MAKGSFDSEIRQAMTPGGDVSPPSRQSAPSQGNAKPPAPSQTQPKGGAQLIRPATAVRIPQPANDPVSHAAAIAHAILQHGRAGLP